MFLARLSSKRLKPLAPRPTVSLLSILVLHQKQIGSGISMDCFTDVLILHVYDSFTNDGTTERLLALPQSNDKNCQNFTV